MPCRRQTRCRFRPARGLLDDAAQRAIDDRARPTTLGHHHVAGTRHHSQQSRTECDLSPETSGGKTQILAPPTSAGNERPPPREFVPRCDARSETIIIPVPGVVSDRSKYSCDRQRLCSPPGHPPIQMNERMDQGFCHGQQARGLFMFFVVIGFVGTCATWSLATEWSSATRSVGDFWIVLGDRHSSSGVGWRISLLV